MFYLIVTLIGIFLAAISISLSIYIMNKTIKSFSHKCYRNCDFTINEDQLHEIFDFLTMLQEENRKGNF